MKKVLVIEVHHKSGNVEFVEIDANKDDAVQRVAYCLRHNVDGYLKVEVVTVTEL